ncbi:MAG: stage sporulation protein [Epulopiscium sp.]|jgi:stage V sporulation protein AC|uniref:stage V sporulation protein AC n=1 Tax=Defluviitalea raffinosedens TaxID=1450156 RepID=UPI001DFBC379|nr:stage V sporulation protein AC [Defluviitalea raffinosedens]MBM7687079.1 stage V sporulation protein AC [Defluviitalea raffinosedens]MBZ4667985.1 spoVAC [Defluviitaleaceae bacterium]MDK2787861.1 stage sporulation protein [Candidatus Epulonipiscium sp.]
MDQMQDMKKEYEQLVEKVSPKSNTVRDCARAFWVGGLICTIGELITNIIKSFGYNQDEASMLTTITLVFLGILLTGLDIYDSIGKYAGAGSIVPITGFANSMVSPAIEFKKEGYVFGVGARMFTIAGPVIVYGVIASVIVGIIHYFI